MADVIYKRGPSKDLDNVVVQDGQILVTGDKGEMYVDLPDGRKKITDTSKQDKFAEVTNNGFDKIIEITNSNNDGTPQKHTISSSNGGSITFKDDGYPGMDIATPGGLMASSKGQMRLLASDSKDIKSSHIFLTDSQIELQHWDGSEEPKSCKLTGIATPTANNDAANKLYVDTAILQAELEGGDIDIDLSNYVTKEDLESKPGRETVENGEIFNDYINNKAYASHVHTEGYSNIGGIKAFSIVDVLLEPINGYRLDSVEGLEPDDVFSAHIAFVNDTDPTTILSEQKDNYGKILSINYDENIVIPDVFFLPYDPNKQSFIHDIDDTNDGYDGEKNTFRVCAKPEVGSRFIGVGAHVEGIENQALSKGAHAEGRGSQAVGSWSHAEGNKTKAYYNAHAEGQLSEAMGHVSHAEGYKTKTIGQRSHAEGSETQAIGQRSHAEGANTTSEGWGSHAEGHDTHAIGDEAHSEGISTYANGKGSHAEGYTSIADGDYSHAEGNNTNVTGKSGHAEGTNCNVIGDYGHAEGYGTEAAKTAHAEGYSTHALGQRSHAEGSGTITGSIENASSGMSAHAEGMTTQAIGEGAHSEGRETIATGSNSHTEGYKTRTVNKSAHAEGRETIAEGTGAHAEGSLTHAIGNYSHTSGVGTIARQQAQTVIGQYNDNQTDSIFEVGNGTSEDILDGAGNLVTKNRSNAFVVKKNAEGKGYAETQVQGDTDESVVIRGSLRTINDISLIGSENLETVGRFEIQDGQKLGEKFNNNNNVASGVFSHAEGTASIARGMASHTEGCGTQTYNGASYAHAEGLNTHAQGIASHTEGSETMATGERSHAEGSYAQATEWAAHAEGRYTVAGGFASHAEGNETHATNRQAHAEGNLTRATGLSSHAEGESTQAIGDYSHAEGRYTKAQHEDSHASGFNTKTGAVAQTVIGRFNKGNADSLFEVGYGTSDNARANAFEVCCAEDNSSAWAKIDNKYVPTIEEQETGNNLPIHIVISSTQPEAIPGTLWIQLVY